MARPLPRRRGRERRKAGLRPQPEQARGVAAEDRDLVLIAQRGGGEDVVDRMLLPRDRMVAAEHDLTGADLRTRVQAASATASGSSTFGAQGAGDITFRFTGANLTSPVDLSLTVGAATTVSEAIANLETAVSGNSTLQGAQINLTTTAAGNNLVFTTTNGEKFNVAVTGDVQNKLGFGSFIAGAGNKVDYSTIQGVTYNPTTSAAGQV